MTFAHAFGVVCVVAPLVAYAITALRRRPAESPEEFFLGRNEVTPSEFANASVAYGFQIASVSVFFAWGFHYGLGALVNPLCWGIGILLLAALIHRILPHISRAPTLHAFLGKAYGSPAITRLAAVMTLLGLVGAFVAELLWGASVLRFIYPSQAFAEMGAVVLGLLVLFYVWRGGHVAALRTDQYQLAFAHLAFVALVVSLLWLLPGSTLSGSSALALVLGITVAIAFALVLRSLVRLTRHERSSGTRDPVSLFLLVVMGVGILGALGASVVSLQIPADFAALGEDKHLFSFDQGPLNLLSLALLPLVWQFVDITMWQRLGSLRESPTRDDTGRLVGIRLGLRRYALESPVTWILAVVGGVALRYADIGIDGDNVYDGLATIPIALSDNLSHLGWPYAVVAGLFAAGIVAALLSTADAFLVAATLCVTYDVLPTSLKSGATGARESTASVRTGRMAAAGMAVTGLFVYVLAASVGFDVVSVLFGAFSAQVAMFPAMIGALVGKRVQAHWVLASLGLGLSGGLGSTLVSLSNPDWALYAPLWAMGLSAPPYLFGLAMSSARRTHA